MDPVAQFARSTTGWSMLLCLLGGLGVFLPWDLPGLLGPQAGINVWYGGVIGLAFLLLLLYQLGTSPLEQRSVWRAVVMFVGGTVILLLFMFYAYGLGQRWPENVGCWFTFLSTVGLLVVAAVEMRLVLARQRREG